MRLSLPSALAHVGISISFLSDLAHGHGYMYSPRTRNWVAHVEGGSNTPGVPPSENDQHGLNTNPPDLNPDNERVCGFSKNTQQDYNTWLDSTGAPMPWVSQDTFTANEEFTVQSYLSTHHAGHMELKACVLAPGQVPTQTCFDQNPMVFVSDEYGMPKDDNYPERGYYAFGESTPVKDFTFTYKFPPHVYGERVLLQWRYITANSCLPPGYNDYFTNSDINFPEGNHWKPFLGDCPTPFPSTGDVSNGYPEQFWNCAEVTVLNPVPTISPKPSPSPTTPIPTVTSAPTENRNGCCSNNWQACDANWYNNEDQCEGDVLLKWLKRGELDGCIGAWSQRCYLTYGSTPCCPGLACVGDEHWATCQKPDPSADPVPTKAPVSPPTKAPVVVTDAPTKAPVVTSPPTDAPTKAPVEPVNAPLPPPACCTFDFKQCVDFCHGSPIQTEADCDQCPSAYHWTLEGDLTASDCMARDFSCTHDGTACCPGLTCVEENNYFSRCVLL